MQEDFVGKAVRSALVAAGVCVKQTTKWLCKPAAHLANSISKRVALAALAVAIMFAGCEQSTEDGPPALTGTVTITGTGEGGAVTEGELLTANVGALDVPGNGSEDWYHYRWQKKAEGEDADWTNIEDGGTDSTYTPVFDDIEHTLKVLVTVDGYSGGVESAATAAVTGAATHLYKVKVDPMTGGSVTASPAIERTGQLVTLTVTPADGYRLKSGTLKVNNGTVGVIGEGSTYTFLMPDANVTVTAQFESNNSTPVDTVDVSITITTKIGEPGGGDIFDPEEDGEISISKSGADNSSFTAKVSDEYTVIQWYLNHEKIDGERGTGQSITINAADYSAGHYSLTVWVTKDGGQYSADIPFTVSG
jgi:hypothetical protein